MRNQMRGGSQRERLAPISDIGGVYRRLNLGQIGIYCSFDYLTLRWKRPQKNPHAQQNSQGALQPAASAEADPSFQPI